MPAKESSIDFINKIYGKVTVIDDLGINKKSRYVLGLCECGNKKQFRLSDLKNGSSTNCGCVRKSGLKDRNTTHGLTDHQLYNTWRGMIERCTYIKHVHYKHYGGRGISVCPKWHDFLNFYNWAIENGWEEGLEIDRTLNDGNYTPQNCRFVSPTINKRNRSSNRILTFNGESLCMSEWGERTGLDQSTIKDRLNKLGWSVEKALTTPLNAHLC